MKSSVQTLGLSDRDKTPKPFSFNFHHTNPQRHVPCILGNMLGTVNNEMRDYLAGTKLSDLNTNTGSEHEAPQESHSH